MSIDVRMLDSRSFLIDIKSSKVLSIKIDTELLTTIDKMWRNLGYSSRSEFVRDSLILILKLIKLMKEMNIDQSTFINKNDQPLASLYKVIENMINKHTNLKPTDHQTEESSSVFIG